MTIENDTLLEHYHENLFVRLEFHEFSENELVCTTHNVKERYSGAQLYGSETKVITGVFNEIRYPPGSVSFTSQDLHKWKALYLQNGPKDKRRSLRPLPGKVQIIQAKNEDGILIWNNNLPVAYTEGFGL